MRCNSHTRGRHQRRVSVVSNPFRELGALQLVLGIAVVLYALFVSNPFRELGALQLKTFGDLELYTVDKFQTPFGNWVRCN